MSGNADAVASDARVVKAMRVLSATTTENYDVAERLMNEFAEEAGVRGLEICILTWIDATTSYMKWPTGSDSTVTDASTMVILDADGVEVTGEGLNDLPPGASWCQEIIGARVSRDSAKFYEMLALIDSDEKLDWVELLLQTLAMTCRVKLHSGTDRRQAQAQLN